MSFLSKKKNVLQYYLYKASGHLIFCRGPIDKVFSIRANEKKAWVGEATEGELAIGGGGISGIVEVLFGYQTQGQNSFLAQLFGALTPAYRRRVSLILKLINVGKTPTWPAIDMECQRIHVKDDGVAQWYNEKAEINAPLSEYAGATFILNWEQSSYHPSNDDDAGMGFRFYNAAGDMISESFASIIGTAHGAWTARTWSAVIPSDTFRIRVFMRMRRDVGTYNDGYIRNITLGVVKDGVKRTTLLMNNTGNLGTLGWTNEYGSLDVRGTPPLCYFTGGDNNAYTSAWQEINKIGFADMNPVHIIRECLMSPDFGASTIEEDIDDANFKAVADTLWDEGLGLSFLWDSSSNILEFVELVRRHINAELFIHPETGKWTIKLIRDDYTLESLPVFNPSNIVSIPEYKAQQFAQLTNSVTVNYINPSNYETSAVTVTDPALVHMQGQVNVASINYEGVSNATLATRLARRELRAASRPLISCTMLANTEAADLLLGDVVKVTWPDLNMDETVMRVVKVGYGTSTSNRVQVTLVQDVFSLPDFNYAVVSTGPSKQDVTPAPCPNHIVIEAPYIEAVTSFGQSSVDAVLDGDPTAGFILVAGSKPIDAAVEMDLYTDDGSGYQYITTGTFCATASLTASIGKDDTTFAIENVDGLDTVSAGTWLMLGTERMKYVSYSAPNLTVKRAILDTVPVAHTAGDTLFFIDEFNLADDAPYAAGATIDAKLLPRTSEDVLALADAPADSHTFAGIMVKPYPAGRLKINATYWPTTVSGAFTVTWVARNRQTQISDDYVGFVDAAITAATNTRYGLRFRRADTNAILVERSDIGPSTASVTLNYTGDVTMEMWTIDDFGASWQKHVHTFAYTPPGGSPTNTITATAYTPVFNGIIIDGGGA